MKFRYISDSHTHSECSFDGSDSIVMMCERACEAGLYSLAITDHCDCNEYTSLNTHESISRSVKGIQSAKAIYSRRLHVLKGIELGQPTQDPVAADDALSLAEYDFVLGSLHNLRGEQDFYFLEYNEQNVPELLDRYFNELLELAQQNLFDSLAHLDYPMRYITGSAGIHPDMNRYQDKLDTVLETLVKNDRALEINTSGLRQVIGRTIPGAEVLTRFRELGGKYVTLGSDAHRWADIGSGIEHGLELLMSCGYTHFTIFDKREPVMLPIQ